MYAWLFLLISYIPFQIALNLVPGFDLASLRIFILLLFAFYLTKNIIDKKMPKLHFKNLPAICLLTFLALTIVSLINAENIFWGVRKIVFFASIFPLYFLVIGLINNCERTKKVISVLFYSTALFSFIGILQFLCQFIFGLEKFYSFWATNIIPIFSGFNLGAMILAYPSLLVNLNGQTVMRTFSLFSDPHIFSFYLGLIIPLGITFALLIKSRKVLFLNFGLMFFALILTFARGAYFAIVTSFIVLAFLIYKYLGNKKTALLILSVLLIFIIPVTPIADRFYSSFDLNEGSNMGRLEMWSQSGKIALDNFWQGVGLGNYALTVDAQFDYRNPVTAHNLYLDILSEMGIFALVIWLLLFLGTIGQIFLKLKKTIHKKEKYILIGLIGSLTYLLVHSFFETPIYSPSVLALIMVILGMSHLKGRALKDIS
jgi:O-antigen ligase